MAIDRRGLLKILPGAFILPKIDFKYFNGIDPTEFNLSVNPSSENGRVSSYDFFINYSNPPIINQDSSTIYTLFGHPTKEVSREMLNCPDNRWTQQRVYLSKFFRGAEKECIDMKKSPPLINFTRKTLRDDPDLVGILYFDSKYGYYNSAVLVFHPDYVKDLSFHLKKLWQLRNPPLEALR